jgi:hypothetical protein
MELYLQFGYGMMEHCRVLVGAWHGGTVILSPRDLNPEQIVRFASEITDLPGGQVLIDPQFYLPHSDHERLTSHSFWPSDYATSLFWSGAESQRLVERILTLNENAGSSAVILPGLYADVIDDDWLARQKQMTTEARRQAPRTRLYATVALASDTARSADAVHEILEALGDWPVQGIYLVAEHPRGDYLVSDPNWLANIVDLIAGIRLQHRDVIVGYANHQFLAAALGSANAVASGTWKNVRSFPPEKFREDEQDPKKRATWVYCPQALSEYKLPSLDMAHRGGVLASMSPGPGFNSSYVQRLFSGPQPSAIGIPEGDAFRHYLECLRVQALGARLGTFAATAAAHEQTLTTAKSLLARLHARGVLGATRDFEECIEANQAVVASIRSTRGPTLERMWSKL